MDIKAFLALGVSSFLLLFSSCNKKEKKMELNYFSTNTTNIYENKGKVFLEGKLFTGKLYTLNVKDTIYKATYINGLKCGTELICYSSSEKKEIREYKNGLLDGVAKGWYKNGLSMFEYHFKNDVFDGKYLEFYENGVMYRNQNYKNGQEFGVQQVWNIDGKIKINYVIKDGRRFGLLGTKNCKNVTQKLFK
jgi:antitoxin component YwqK of YwqJK toxin-antitoxin module